MNHDFVGLAHEHESAHDFEAAVLERTERSIGFDAAFVLVAGQEQYLTARGLDLGVQEKLRKNSADYARELAPVKRAAQSARGVAVDTDILGERLVRASRYHREIARSVAGRHSLLAYLSKGPQPFGLVMLGRGTRSFSHAELKAVESCLPTLSLGRAAFGLPWASTPLPDAASAGLLARMGLRERRLAETPLSDGKLVVRDRGRFREMVAHAGDAELVWTRADRATPSISGWPYADLFHVALARARARRRALLIGCGGGVSARQFAEVYPGLEIDVVESEESVIEMARTFFGLGEIPRLTLHVADGQEFVRQAPASSWDVLVVDAFTSTALADGFCEPAFLAAAKRALQPGGSLAFNLIGSLAGDGSIATFAKTAQRVFDSVRLVPVVDLNEDFSAQAARNVVVIATRV